MSTMRTMLSDMLLLLASPHEYAAGCTQRGKKLWHDAYRLSQPRKSKRIAKLRESILGASGGIPRFDIPEHLGYVFLSGSQIPESEDAVSEARAIFDRTDLAATVSAMPAGKPFTRLPWCPSPSSAICEFATNNALVGPICRYLRSVPTLRATQLMFSPNHQTVGDSSQFYHLDGQDVRSIQVFCYLEDVTPESGPLTLLDAQTSARILKKTGYRKRGLERRLLDDRVRDCVAGQLPAISCVGPRGSVLIFDGDRCLHFGSRQASKPRKILHYAYSTPFSFTLTPGEADQFQKFVTPQLVPWQRAVLGNWK